MQTLRNKLWFSDKSHEKSVRSQIFPFPSVRKIFENELTTGFARERKSIFLFLGILLQTPILFAQAIFPLHHVVDALEEPFRITANGEKYIENVYKILPPLELSANDILVNQGAMGCVDVTANSFTNINLMEFTLRWNGTLFTFEEVNNFGIPGMTAADFTPNAAAGSMSVNWADPSGQTVDDGTVIFSVCFTASGPVGNTSIFNFNSIPTNIYVTDLDSGTSHIGLNTDDGSMTIQSSVSPLVITGADVVDVNCNNENGGSIDISFEGGLAPFTFNWDSGQMTEDINGLSAGDYTVVITDSDAPATSIMMTYTIDGDLTPPAVSVGGGGSIDCNNTTLTLDGTGSDVGMNFSYLWTTTDGNIVSGNTTLMPQVDAVGTYKLMVTNDLNGCSASAEVEVTGDVTMPTADAGMDIALDCSALLTTLDGSGSDTGPTLVMLWSTLDGNIVSGTNTAMPQIDAPGTYTITVTNTTNGCAAEDDVVVSAANLPTASAGENMVLDCDNPILSLDGSMSTMGDEVGYTWTTLDGNIVANETTTTPDVDAPGTYEILVTDISTGCTATASVIVTGDGNVPTADAGMSLELDCDNNIVTLDGSASSVGADFTYNWTTTDGNVLSGANTLMPEVGSAGTYILMVTNTDNECTASANVEVSASTDMPLASVVPLVEISCDGSSINLDGNSSSMGAEFNYLWTTSNGNIVMGETTLNPEINKIGSYELVVTNTDNNCSAMASVEVFYGGNLERADAGDDIITCFDTATVVANLPEGTMGVWTTDFIADIDDPTNNQTGVTGLISGVNQFVWTLSSADCMDYSSDTLFVVQEGTPETNDDQQIIALGAPPINIDVTQNDDFSGVGSWDFFLLNDPESGNLENLGDGQLIYTLADDFTGTLQINYEICNFACVELCDSATLFIIIEEKNVTPPAIDSLAIPNGITPNGDGINDAFVFDVILENPSQYPESELLVFNRWGDVVYQSKPYNNDWEGTNQNGQPLPEGTYYYIMRLDIANSEIIRGDITIIK